MSAMCVECGEFTSSDQIIKCKICPLTYHKWCADIDLYHRARVRWHCPKDFDMHLRFIKPQQMEPPPVSMTTEMTRLLNSINVGSTYMPKPLDDADILYNMPMDHDTFGRVEYRQTPYGLIAVRPCAYRLVKSRLMIYNPSIYIPPMHVPTLFVPVTAMEGASMRPPPMQKPPMQMPPTQPPSLHIPMQGQMHVQQQMQVPHMLPMGMPTRPQVFAGYNGGYNRYHGYN